eukprot:7939678-Pyramimonas_sp.AAC.1
MLLPGFPPGPEEARQKPPGSPREGLERPRRSPQGTSQKPPIGTAAAMQSATVPCTHAQAWKKAKGCL